MKNIRQNSYYTIVTGTAYVIANRLPNGTTSFLLFSAAASKFPKKFVIGRHQFYNWLRDVPFLYYRQILKRDTPGEN